MIRLDEETRPNTCLTFPCDNSCSAFWEIFIFQSRNWENKKSVNLGCKFKLNNKYRHFFELLSKAKIANTFAPT